MKRLMFTTLLALLAMTAVMARPADADEADMYVFGTKFVLTSPRQLVDPNTGWWADLLPTEYSYSIGTIVSAVNEARKARGVSEMIDVKTYPVSVGGEMPAGKDYEYNIDFMRMTPEDVQVVLEKFPLTGKLSDLPHELRPIGVGYFYANTTQPGGSLALDLAGQKLAISPDASFTSVQQMVADALAARFAGRAKFDLSLNRYTAATGTNSFDVNVTVYLDGAENNPGYAAPYDGEGGE